MLATTLQPRGRGATDQDTIEVGRRIANDLKAAGFMDVNLEHKAMKPVSAVCAVARR